MGGPGTSTSYGSTRSAPRSSALTAPGRRGRCRFERGWRRASQPAARGSAQARREARRPPSASCVRAPGRGEWPPPPARATLPAAAPPAPPPPRSWTTLAGLLGVAVLATVLVWGRDLPRPPLL